MPSQLLTETNPDTQFWMVWSPNSGLAPTAKHATGDSAVKEADRLAALNPGQRFYVLKALRYAHRVQPTAIVELRGQSPF